MTQDRPNGDRIAKVMARSGTCSRREAERWIVDGRVQVNGHVITSPALNITDRDTVVVDGTALKSPEPPRLWLYHKPPGLVTTHKDPEGRATVFEALPDHLPRVISVGRLDLNSEGLLLLTNDGALARTLEQPKTGWVRRYRVRAFGRPPHDMIQQLANGMTVDGVVYGAIDVVREQTKGPNKWYVVSLAEGKNREIRRVFEALGLSVSRLIRTAYGPFELGSMKREAVTSVPMRTLRTALDNTDFDVSALKQGPLSLKSKKA